MTNNIKSALFAYSRALSTPIFSTTSEVSRIPAVSIKFKLIPFNRTVSSIISRVVPAISLTITLFSPKILFFNIL